MSGHGELAAVNACLEFGTSADSAHSGRGITALISAAMYNQTAVVQRLLQPTPAAAGKASKGLAARINRADIDTGLTPLIAAVIAGHMPTIRVLLKANPPLKLDMQTEQGLTALMMAARDNRFQALSLLLTAKPKPADPNRVDDEKQSALFVCAHGGFLGCARALLNAPDIRVDAADQRGLTPLHAAVIMGRAPIVRALLAHTPAPDVLTIRHSGETPFTSACHFGHVDIARMLRAACPDLDVNHAPPNGSLATALNGAIAGGHAAVVRYLLLEVQPPAAFIAGPEAPVLTAAGSGFTEILDMILQAAPAVRLTSVDADGRSALVLAARGGHAHAVTALLRHRQWRVPAAELAAARRQQSGDEVARALQNATAEVAVAASVSTTATVADQPANATAEKTEL